MILKKLYVLRALELSKHRNRLLRESLECLSTNAEQSGRSAIGAPIQPTAQILEGKAVSTQLKLIVYLVGLETFDESPESDVEEAWRVAEAFHFLTLANRMMHQGYTPLSFQQIKKGIWPLRKYRGRNEMLFTLTEIC